MKIVVIGGSGLIGSKVVKKLAAQGHEAVPASPNSGVNTLTGEGLAEVLKRAQVVVDVSNSPSFEDKAVMEFFMTSTGNLMKYEAAAGVRHHVALSVVGTAGVEPIIPAAHVQIDHLGHIRPLNEHLLLGNQARDPLRFRRRYFAFLDKI